MRALVLFGILLGLLALIYAAASSRPGSPGRESASGPTARSTADTLTIIAVREDNGDEEAARASFSHCLEILRSRYKDPDDRLGDMIYNTKTMLQKAGIQQRLVDCATDLAEITPLLTDGQGSLRDSAAAYVTLRNQGNDRTNAVEMTSAVFRRLGQISDAVSEGDHHVGRPPPASRPAETVPTTELAQPAAPSEDPKTSMHFDLKDKWQHAITVTVELAKSVREADLLKVRQVVIGFTFDATYGRENQVDRLKDAIIAAVGEEIRDSLAVDLDWKL